MVAVCSNYTGEGVLWDCRIFKKQGTIPLIGCQHPNTHVIIERLLTKLVLFVKIRLRRWTGLA